MSKIVNFKWILTLFLMVGAIFFGWKFWEEKVIKPREELESKLSKSNQELKRCIELRKRDFEEVQEDRVLRLKKYLERRREDEKKELNISDYSDDDGWVF